MNEHSAPTHDHQQSLHIVAFGDSALLATSSSPEAQVRWATAHSIALALKEAELSGIEGIVATFDSVMVEFDCLVIDALTVESWLHSHRAEASVPYTSGRTVSIPLLYGGEGGPDLPAVAQELDLSTDDLIEAHSSAMWRVSFLGAPAGAPLHEASAFAQPISRMPEPRTRIPAGTIAVSGFHGTIYTIEAPGGWRLLGRTPLRIVNNSAGPFTAIAPGDLISYRPISPREFERTAPEFIGALL